MSIRPALSGRLRRVAWRAGRRLYFDARGEVANSISGNGETYVQRCVVRAVARTGEQPIIFDIGANVGEWTAALLGILGEEKSGARILAFEPVPSTREALERNLAGRPNAGAVEIVPLAMSDAEGTASMSVVGPTSGTNTLEFRGASEAASDSIIEVRTTTVDAFCGERGIARVHLVKCDAEGHDAKIVAGARGMLRDGRIDVFQFEYNHRWIYARAFMKDVFDLVAGLPYRVARLRPRQIEVFEAWHPEIERFFEGNYLLVHESKLAAFDVLNGRFDPSNTYA